MKIKNPFITAILIFFFSCNQKKEQTPHNIFTPKVMEAKPYLVPKDSMATPKSVLAGKPTIIKAGKPKPVTLRTNIHLAGIPRTVVAGTPKICTPGKDSFSLPKKVPAINRPFVAGIPEVVIARDAGSKDQNSQNFSSFTKQEGLKATPILCMLQDRSGNIWFGTWGGGVSRYDGKYFTHLTPKEGLSDNNVWSICEDRAGNLWFGTVFGGVSKYDGKTFTNFTEKEGLAGNYVLCILADRSGNIWFGTNEGGVSRLNRDGKTFTHYTKKEGLISNTVNDIVEDSSGNIWFGTGGGISKFDGNSFRNYTEKEGLGGGDVLSIFQDKAGNLWFGTNGGGVCRLDRDGKTFTHYTEKEGLINNLVTDILEDRSGNFWFGTWGGGISKYDGTYFTNFTEKDGLSNNVVKCILEDGSGGLWFGTDRGGLSKYNGKTFTHFTRNEGLSENDVGSICEDRAGNLWFGTVLGGVSKYDGKTFTNFTEKEGLDNGVRSTLEDRSGNLWFGTNGGGVFKYDGKSFTNFTVKEGLGDHGVFRILQDKTGNLWFAHEFDGGVSRLDRDGKYFTHYTEKEGLSNNSVGSFLEDKFGNLWFGTGRGVSRLDRDGKTFKHFTIKEGLSGNTVSGMIEDKSGNIWIGTDQGVSRLDRDGKTFTHYTEKEGLSNNNVSSIFEDRSGNFWFGTDFGLNKLTPESLLKVSAQTKIPEDKGGSAGHPNNDRPGDVLFKSYSYEDGFLGIGCIGNAILEDENGTIWIGTNDRLTAYHPEGDKKDTMAPNMQLTGVALFNESISWANLEQKKDTSFVLGNGVSVRNFKFEGISKWYYIPEHLSLPYNNNYLTFNFIGITTKSPQKVKYQYKLEGLEENWSAFTTRNEAAYGNLPHGNYTFQVKAMNSDGYWSKEFNYSFIIRPPWWKTWWFRTLMAITFLFLLYGIYRWRTASLRRQKRVLEQTVKERTAEVVEEKAEVERQKEKSDELLLNILPSEVAEELKEKGYTTAKSFDEVTILFSDIKGFTNVAERLTAQELVKEIDTYFSAFDNIILKYGLEKIKTIGDAYIAAGGLPEKNAATAQNVVEAAIAMQQAVEKLKQERVSSNKPYFELRIGIHTGPVVAGVVGIKKFQYDIWGDTVNLAARMEQSGVPGKINISQHTYELVKEQFNCIHRGKIEAKNKGDIDMYFVDQVKK